MSALIAACGPTSQGVEPAAGEQVEAVPAGTLSVQWQADGQCRQATLDRNENVRYGSCGGSLTTLQLGEATVEASSELGTFVDQYASFTAETAAGTVTFGGQGSQVATAAEQRMLGEWARWLAREAEAGDATISDGVVFTWHRVGGADAACDIVTLYITGVVETRSCHREPPQLLSRTRLSAGQLDQLYTWADGLASFETSTDANGASIRLFFAGTGSVEARSADQQAMTTLAETLFSAVGDSSTQ
jgi:hypothetical protein